jgi:hypothetical protein
VPRVYRAAIEGNVGGEPFVNVLHFEEQNTGGAEGLVNALEVAWVTQLINITARDTTFTKIVAVEVVRVGMQDAYEKAINLKNAGNMGATSTPQLALRVAIRTGQYGATRRGRFFLAGIPDEVETGGRLTAQGSGFVASWTAAAITPAFVGPNPSTGYRLGVFSRSRYALLSNPFDAWFAGAINLSPATVFSTMRSRKPAG